MTELPDSTVWRVGYTGDPLGFVPWDRCGFGHRFDDLHRRFRSLYVGLLPETCLREVLADLRPNAAAIRRFVETDLLHAHGLEHLDMHEITTRRRVVTQTITADAYDSLGVAAIRFPSSRDGNACYALLEGRAHLEPTGPIVALTDPAPEPLVNVCASWGLRMADAPSGDRVA